MVDSQLFWRVNVSFSCLKQVHIKMDYENSASILTLKLGTLFSGIRDRNSAWNFQFKLLPEDSFFRLSWHFIQLFIFCFVFPSSIAYCPPNSPEIWPAECVYLKILIFGSFSTILAKKRHLDYRGPRENFWENIVVNSCLMLGTQNTKHKVV